jgi:hypothetical protein
LKTIVFENDISAKNVYDLISDIEKIDENEEWLSNGDRKYFQRTIYFCSGGGDVGSANILIDFINNSEQFIFTLVGYWCISSAAFSVFMKSKCERRLISENTFSIIHLSDRDSSSRELKKSKSLDKFLLEEMEKCDKKEIEWFLEIGVTPEQVEDVKAGEDVTIGYDQLNEILNNTIVIFNRETREEEIQNIKQTIVSKYPELNCIKFSDCCDCDVELNKPLFDDLEEIQKNNFSKVKKLKVKKNGKT